MNALISATESTVEMEIELVFHEEYMIHRTIVFYEIVDDNNIVLTDEESFWINYFLYIVDQAIFSIQNRFKSWQYLQGCNCCHSWKKFFEN